MTRQYDCLENLTNNNPAHRRRPIFSLFTILLSITPQLLSAGSTNFLAALPRDLQQNVATSSLRSWYLPPVRVLWQSEHGVNNSSSLLQAKPGQAVLSEPSPP